MTAVEVFLGLGSNEGDRRQYIERGVAGLRSGGVDVVRRSSLYETEPVGVEDQPWFLNLVVEGRTGLGPRALLGLCQRIEEATGRVRALRFGPRTLDVDILLYGDEVVWQKDLEIPHPRMSERRFVLVPLLEIAPEARDPRDGRRFAEILDGLDDEKKVRRSKANGY